MNRTLTTALIVFGFYAQFDSRTCATQIQMLWTSHSLNKGPEIQAAYVDGSGVRAILPTAWNPSVLSVAVDPRDGMVYFGRYAADYTINRVGIDGGEPQILYSLQSFNSGIVNATPSPFGISIDTVHNKLYWAGGKNPSGGERPGVVTLIQRSNLDGSNVETLRQFLARNSAPRGLVVNGTSQEMYWTDEATQSIMRANLDGTGAQTVLTGAESVHALAIDFDDQRVFWSETDQHFQNSRIKTALLDGSEIQTIMTNVPIHQEVPGLYVFSGLAVDPSANKLYFTVDTFFGYGGVLSANYDGSGLQTLIPQSAGASGIAILIPEPPTSLLAGVGGLAVFARRRRSRTTLRPGRADFFGLVHARTNWS
jgi:hypothetical protein